MLQKMTSAARRAGIPATLELLEWNIYQSLEPLDTERADWRAADIVRTLLNINRDPKKHPKPFTLQECRMAFGDYAPQGPTRKQTWQEQKEMLRLYAISHAESGARSRAAKKPRSSARPRRS